MDIQLVIKAPNQNFADHVVHCNLEWTIGKLKHHLSREYPNRPRTYEQKLIYSGRLLHDHLHLKDILRRDEDQSSVHILHLVCQSDCCPSRSQRNSSSHNRRHRSSGNRNNSNVAAGQSSENSVRRRNVNPAPQANNTFYPQVPTVLTPPPSTLPAFTPDSQVAAQMAAMQQMYAYYFAQYMQSMNSISPPGSGGVFPNLMNFQQPPNLNEVPPPPPVNQRNNAQGPLLLEENEEGMHRDWLEHVFQCCRFFVLFCIVYFYSSPERLMIVIVGTIVVFLYHEGWFMRRANPAVPQELNGPPGVPDNVDMHPEFENNENDPYLVNQGFGANVEVQDEYELEAAMDGEEPPHAQHEDMVNNNRIFSPLTFLQTFFSSLIPEPPPPVNIN
ncbi:homocysteine-responsive endoplasmic reticulum-resident ubiquitin-like domain member 2 protein [Trichonephila clavata]|uniref:Homocysteine-responsive endoplasmic reticulum-resident ubiquitin-like domain member 2 protein n=1 Tax=Trichonephila clavata TaxID=2740835 RepID=A0A8X6HU49_TRICU|nr:homocysteine-responsive endoplasmic reticulum-resident ubiquitin-like domain member 2 protein [Trichonephila clavata]